MSIVEIAILAGLGLALFFALRRLIKARRSGCSCCCAQCGGCSRRARGTGKTGRTGEP